MTVLLVLLRPIRFRGHQSISGDDTYTLQPYLLPDGIRCDSMDDDIDYLQHLINEYEKLNGKETLPVVVVITKADAVPPPNQFIQIE
ncbi:MAG: hypothetical protein IKD50_09255 [Clostridia bacterium]|nr:hypothetical protein [Clostridia bacterium]